MRRKIVALSSIATLLACAPTRAIILRNFDTNSSTGDPTSHSSAPTGTFAGSGWQYVGQWNGAQGFTGVPIGPHTYLTVAHVDPGIGTTFAYNGVDYTSTADNVLFVNPSNPNTSRDLRVVTVSGTFPTWAPLYDPSIDGSLSGKTVVMIGRGTQRGTPVNVAAQFSQPNEGTLRGWTWGTIDGVQRWGTNVVSAINQTDNSGNGYDGRSYFQVNFDFNGLTDEGMISDHDSGGGVFVQGAGGVWKLAGIIHGVLSDYKVNSTDPNGLKGALFDYDNLYYLSGYDNTPQHNPIYTYYNGGLFPAFGDINSVSSALTQLSPYLESGDVNRDGKVNTSDFMTLAANFNKTTGMSWTTGDFNGDGTVNALDFNALATNFGVTYSSTSAPALGVVVPEPTSIGVLSLLAVALAGRQPRH